MGTKAVLRREFKAARKADRNALKIAAREIERRLKHLNGETARAAAVASGTVQKGTYEAERQAHETRLKALESSEDKRAGALRLIGLLAAGGFMTGLIGLVGLIWQASTHPATQQTPQVYYVPAAPGTLVPSTPPQQQR